MATRWTVYSTTITEESWKKEPMKTSKKRYNGIRENGYHSGLERTVHEGVPRLKRVTSNCHSHPELNCLKKSFKYIHPWEVLEKLTQAIQYMKANVRLNQSVTELLEAAMNDLMHSYTPDFYDPENGEYVEVKGRIEAKGLPLELSKWKTVSRIYKLPFRVLLQYPEAKYGKSRLGVSLSKHGILWESVEGYLERNKE